MFRQFLLCAFFICLPVALTAQPLADRVPAEAVVYVGWAGQDSPGSNYERSHLKGILDSSNLRAIGSQLVPELLRKLGEANAGAGAHARTVQAILDLLWRHPSAVFFAGVDFDRPGGPMPRAGLICRAGNESEQLLRHVNDLLGQMGNSPLRAANVGDAVVLTIGYENPGLALARAGVNRAAIGADARFTSALAKVQKEPSAVLYADGAGLVALFDRAAAAAADPMIKERWPKVRDALGLPGLKSFIWTGAFAGAEWETRCFMNAPAPRKGVLALMDQAPVSDAFLQTIPKTATFVSAGRLDLAKLLAGIRSTAQQIDPGAPQSIDQGLGVVQMATRVDLQTGLFETLGDEWAAYTDPMVGGKGFMSLVLVNSLRKPAEAKQSLERLELFIQNFISGQMRGEEMRVRIETAKVGEEEIHYAAVPAISPAWAVKNGKLYVGFYPQTVASALAQPGKAGNSILDNPAYVALRKRLEAPQTGAVQFMNLPETAGESYGNLLYFSQLALGFADMMGINVPAMVIPPLHTLRAHLSPSESVAWVDESGWHRRSITPFPGATILASEQSVVIGAGALGVSIMLPAVSAAKERANRVHSAVNLRQIGQGCLLYANDNRGRYPEDLGTLVIKADLNAPVFVDPSSGKVIPPAILNGTPAQQALWVNANSDYVYLGHRIRATDGADRIIAHSKLEAHQNEGMNVLFNDGHVEWFTADQVPALLQAEDNRARELPNRPAGGRL